MAKYQLFIYGDNDEIVKTYETDHVRWRIFGDVLEANEKAQGAPVMEQFEMISGFVKRVFPGLTDEELGNADAADIFNVFKQLLNIAAAINTKNG